MNNEETIIAIITSFLAVSELLPFMKNTGNGVLHTITVALLKICTVTLKGLKKENNNVQKS